MIVLIAGLPGTGKSTLAGALASRLNGTVLSKDEIRHAIFSPAEVEYSTVQDDFVMQIMLEAAAWILRKDPKRTVFLDGRTFSRRYQIDRVIAAAEDLKQPWRILECVCAEETAGTRIEAQTVLGEHPAANRNFDLYLEVKAHFEEIVLLKTVIDTDQLLEESVGDALQALL
ncbi:MAG TPA: AAA family ATPase [Terriglobales bacterium]|nr:AAA family ATPase [Terriglobales bacterium]